jgi:hypothetical protein
MTETAFEEVAERTGLRFHHFNGATGEYYLPETMGPGVALFDYDNDGDLDVFLAQGDFLEAGKTLKDAAFPLPQGWKRGSRLFRNELIPEGKLRFTDVTDVSGIVTGFDAMGAAVGDYDNNGTLDLLVTGFGKCALFKNGGDGKFIDVSRQIGIDDGQFSTSAAFVDYDRDGWLDLFVAHYVRGTTAERKHCHVGTGGRVFGGLIGPAPSNQFGYCNPSAYQPTISRLYHNEHGRRFRDVTVPSGIGSAPGPGLGVLIADFNGDGWPDIYVANDGAASHLWLNQKNGTFREAGVEFGVSYSADGKAQAGMGVALGDIDNDGQEEILKTNLHDEGANVYKKGAGGVYTDVARQINVLSATLSLTGFGVGFADFDNDGWMDGFVANGGVATMADQQRTLLLHNIGGSFKEVLALDGPLAERSVGRGVAFGDIDNDGAIDFVVANNNGPARLFLNTLAQRGFDQAHWLRVRLESRDAGLRGYQAVVYLESESGIKQMRRVDPAGSYLSASDAVAHFGLGKDRRIKSLSVVWPDRSKTTHAVDAIDKEIRIRMP